METYTCKLRLSGALANEVPKIGVTIPEMVLLQSQHGHDAISDVKHAGTVERDEGEERARLLSIYAKTGKGRAHFERVLGQEHMPLPTRVPGVSLPKPRKTLGRKATDSKAESDSADSNPEMMG
jgi:hypothetical protein